MLKIKFITTQTDDLYSFINLQIEIDKRIPNYFGLEQLHLLYFLNTK